MYKKPRKRLLTPETVRLSRSRPRPAQPKRPYGGIVIESAEGFRWFGSSKPLPKPEINSVEVGSIEVNPPNPDETFAMPIDGPAQWVKYIVTRRRNERSDENHGD